MAAIAYVLHARRTPAPVLDLSLLKLSTFRASVFGGFLFRLGIGALPFLLPLLLQIGFNLTPFLACGLLFLVMTVPLTRFVDWLVARDRRRQMAGIAR